MTLTKERLNEIIAFLKQQENVSPQHDDATYWQQQKMYGTVDSALDEITNVRIAKNLTITPTKAQWKRIRTAIKRLYSGYLK